MKKCNRCCRPSYLFRGFFSSSLETHFQGPQQPITFKLVYQISISYKSAKKVFIAFVLRSQRFLAEVSGLKFTWFIPARHILSQLCHWDTVPALKHLLWLDFSDRLNVRFEQTAALAELHLISLKIPIRLFLLHFNEHCLRELKGWQVTVPALPLVTSVSSVKTHSRRYASQVPEDKGRRGAKERRGRDR